MKKKLLCALIPVIGTLGSVSSLKINEISNEDIVEKSDVSYVKKFDFDTLENNEARNINLDSDNYFTLSKDSGGNTKISQYHLESSDVWTPVDVIYDESDGGWKTGDGIGSTNGGIDKFFMTNYDYHPLDYAGAVTNNGDFYMWGNDIFGSDNYNTPKLIFDSSQYEGTQYENVSKGFVTSIVISDSTHLDEKTDDLGNKFNPHGVVYDFELYQNFLPQIVMSDGYKYTWKHSGAQDGIDGLLETNSIEKNPTQILKFTNVNVIKKDFDDTTISVDSNFYGVDNYNNIRIKLRDNSTNMVSYKKVEYLGNDETFKNSYFKFSNDLKARNSYTIEAIDFDSKGTFSTSESFYTNYIAPVIDENLYEVVSVFDTSAVVKLYVGNINQAQSFDPSFIEIYALNSLTSIEQRIPFEVIGIGDENGKYFVEINFLNLTLGTTYSNFRVNVPDSLDDLTNSSDNYKEYTMITDFEFTTNDALYSLDSTSIYNNVSSDFDEEGNNSSYLQIVIKDTTLTYGETTNIDEVSSITLTNNKTSENIEISSSEDYSIPAGVELFEISSTPLNDGTGHNNIVVKFNYGYILDFVKNDVMPIETNSIYLINRISFYDHFILDFSNYEWAKFTTPYVSARVVNGEQMKIQVDEDTITSNSFELVLKNFIIGDDNIKNLTFYLDDQFTKPVATEFIEMVDNENSPVEYRFLVTGLESEKNYDGFYVSASYSQKFSDKAMFVEPVKTLRESKVFFWVMVLVIILIIIILVILLMFYLFYRKNKIIREMQEAMDNAYSEETQFEMEKS